MKNSWIIAKKDLGSFFNSPIFYVITTVFLIIYSYIFVNILSFFSMQSMQSGQFQQMGIALNINEMVIEPSFQNMAVVLLLIIPIITMRSFAEEKKSKTFRLLLSSPVHLKEIIWGKFLACMIVITLMVLISSYSIGFLFMIGEPDIGPVLTGYSRHIAHGWLLCFDRNICLFIDGKPNRCGRNHIRLFSLHVGHRMGRPSC